MGSAETKTALHVITSPHHHVGVPRRMDAMLADTKELTRSSAFLGVFCNDKKGPGPLPETNSHPQRKLVFQPSTGILYYLVMYHFGLDVFWLGFAKIPDTQNVACIHTILVWKRDASKTNNVYSFFFEVHPCSFF